MKKRMAAAALALLLAAVPLTASALTHTDFQGNRIGVITGTVCDEVAENNLEALCVYYSEVSAAIEDVRKARIDGFMYDLSAIRVLTGTAGGEDLEVVALPAEFFSMPMGALSVKQGVVDRFNLFLAEMEGNGTLAEMQGRWLQTAPDLDAPMPDIPLPGGNGSLKVATCGTAAPFAYVGDGGNLKGYSIELATRFAAHEGMTIEFADMDFGGLIPYVMSGKADFAIANVSITEERKKSVLFTESIYDDRLAVAVLKPDGAAAPRTDGGLADRLKTGIERNLLTDSRWKMIIGGLGVTVLISAAAQVFGTMFGCLICFLLTRKNRLAKWIANLYCGFIHGTPIVVLLMLTYYIVFGEASVSNVVVAIVAFTVVEGAIIAQNLKAAIETVDPVEIEAARSIGFTAFGAFISVTLPQAVRRALPAYTDGFVELVKSTAVVGYIAIQDLTRAGDIIRSRTYDQYFPLILVALIYLLVTAACVRLFRLAVRKMNGGAAL